MPPAAECVSVRPVAADKAVRAASSESAKAKARAKSDPA
jgi:hypothetical protein